jgi:hypothetical protein
MITAKNSNYQLRILVLKVNFFAAFQYNQFELILDENQFILKNKYKNELK